MPCTCTACGSAETLGSTAASVCTDCVSASVAGASFPLIPMAIVVVATIVFAKIATSVLRRSSKTVTA